MSITNHRPGEWIEVPAPQARDPEPSTAPMQYSHYRKDTTKYSMIDIYRVLRLYSVTDPAIGHAVKKLLCPGGRGVKSQKQDIIEAIATLNRWLDMENEDSDGREDHNRNTT